jgi:hypothetical protein
MPDIGHRESICSSPSFLRSLAGISPALSWPFRIPHFDKGGARGDFLIVTFLGELHRSSSATWSCPISVIEHPSSPPTSHQQSIRIRHARRCWQASLPLPSCPTLVIGHPSAPLRHSAFLGRPLPGCHPDPFDFAQDKGHRRISPSHDIVHPGQILRPGLNPPPSCMPATSRNRSQFLVILQAKSDDEIITNML